jgi:hypothetical protein
LNYDNSNEQRKKVAKTVEKIGKEGDKDEPELGEQGVGKMNA